eukprot:6675277-Heterocapsa_arctica.AAC.1
MQLAFDDRWGHAGRILRAYLGQTQHKHEGLKEGGVGARRAGGSQDQLREQRIPLLFVDDVSMPMNFEDPL